MNTEAIFDAINKASRFVHLQDAINNKTAQIRNVLAKRCSNCFHWMKSSCIPEKKHGQFKSCDSIGCKNFELCPFREKMASDFTEKLNELKAKLLH